VQPIPEIHQRLRIECHGLHVPSEAVLAERVIHNDFRDPFASQRFENKHLAFASSMRCARPAGYCRIARAQTGR
jgi:hypothetical protein